MSSLSEPKLAATGRASPRSTPSSNRVPAVQRAIGILRLIAKRGKLSFADVVADVDVKKTTVFYMLRALCEYELLQYDDETRLYRLGPALLELGAAAREQIDELAVARRYLSELLDRWDVTITISRITNTEVGADGFQLILIDMFEREHGPRISLPLGSVLPWNGAAGQAHLAFASEEVVKRVLATAFSGQTEKLRREFLRGLDVVRERGWAYDVDGVAAGISTISAPIPTEGHAAGGLVANVVALSRAVDTKNIEVYGDALCACCGRIGDMLSPTSTGLLSRRGSAHPSPG
jgi:DNA-binding IclR family transcriptional regulator